MTTYGPRRPVVLQTREPSMGMIQLGKISVVYPPKPGVSYFSYLNNISAEMRKTGEYAVAPCIVDLLRDWCVQHIEYFDKESNTNYWTTPDALKRLGHLVHYGSRPPYWHLLIGHWHREMGRPSSKFAREILTLEWTTPEIARDTLVKQLSLI